MKTKYHLLAIGILLLVALPSIAQRDSLGVCLDVSIGRVLPHKGAQMNLRIERRKLNFGGGFNFHLNDIPHDRNNYVYRKRAHRINTTDVIGLNFFTEKRFASISENHFFIGYSIHAHRLSLKKLNYIFLEELVDPSFSSIREFYTVEEGVIGEKGTFLFNTVYLRGQFPLNDKLYFNAQVGFSIGSYYFKEFRRDEPPLRNNPFLFTYEWDAFIQFMVGIGYRF